MIKNQINLGRAQEKFNKDNGTSVFTGLSLSDTIKQLIMMSKISDAKTLSKNVKMDDIVFREIEAKALIDADKPQEIVKEYL
jgi:hypothetical protein